MHWLERAPLWIIGLVVLGGLIIAQQLGYGVRRLMARSGSGGRKVGAMASATS